MKALVLNLSQLLRRQEEVKGRNLGGSIKKKHSQPEAFVGENHKPQAGLHANSGKAITIIWDKTVTRLKKQNGTINAEEGSGLPDQP